MATTRKKSAKKSKPKPRAKSAAASVAALKKTIAAQAQEIREGAERQAATSEILRVIASSPTDLQPVLDVVVENAARLCDASNAVIQRVHGDCFQRVAHYGDVPETSPFGSHTLNRLTPSGRAILDRQTIHVNDISEH